MPAASYRARGRTGPIEDGRKKQLLLVGAAALCIVFGVVIGQALTSQTAQGEEQSRPVAGDATYPDTKQGAAAAIGDFYSFFLLADLEYADDAKEQLAQKVAPEYLQQASGELDLLLESQEANPLYAAIQNDATYVARAWPLAYRVESFDQQRTSVTVWMQTLAGIKDQAVPRVGFAAAQISARRERGKWLITRMTERPAIVPHISAQKDATTDTAFYEATEGMSFYDAAP